MALQSEVGFDCDKIDITHFAVVALQNTCLRFIYLC